MMPFDAVIFDCDGTLVDSESIACAVICEALDELGVAITVDEAIATFAGHKQSECLLGMERLLGRQLPAEFDEMLRQRTAAAFRTDLRPIDGAIDLVATLRIPSCVASSGPREKIELSLQLTGLLKYFEGRILSSYEVGAWKPDPTLFLHAAEVLSVSPCRCAVVEDSVPGVLAGLAAGMTVFAFMPAAPAPPRGATLIRRLSDLRLD